MNRVDVWCSKVEEKLEEADIGTLIHGILFAYQKTVEEILGTGAAIFCASSIRYHQKNQ